MDTEFDADIESLESLISDEINNSNDDDCSQNSFDAELNLLATTLKENDMKNEPINDNEKCDVQNNVEIEIEPNNHITDDGLKKSMKLSPLQEFETLSDISVSKIEVVDECHKEHNNTGSCDTVEEISRLEASVMDENSNDCTVIEREDDSEYTVVGNSLRCNISPKRESEENCESGNNIGSSGNLNEDCIKSVRKVDEEFEEENYIEINMTDKSNISSVDENETQCKIHCSTPLVKDLGTDMVTENINSIASFGLLSPLATNKSNIDGLHHMKRKLCSETLASIKEEEEEDELIVPAKKPKCDTEDSSCVAKNLKSHMKTIEPPAMAIFKKWRPKCLSSSTTYYVVDECGDAQSSQSEKEDDEFEIAMNSLKEELIKQSDADDLKTLDLYHNHVLAENEEDGLKFEEILQQFTNELEGMSEYISLDKSDGSTITTDNGEKSQNTVLEIDCEKNLSSTLTSDSQKTHDSTLVEKQSVEISRKNDNKGSPANDKPIIVDDDDDDDVIIIKENLKPVENRNEKLTSNNNIDYITLTADEEDELLEDKPEVNSETDGSQKKKPREMVEFISKDPKENEDNFNPEWELLRKLNTDEERYKAVRQRWRSLVIPDPKRDLTFRQWRRRNSLPPSQHLQGNTIATQQQIRNYVGNQLCTALFDQNIEGILRQKEEKRLQLHKELQMEIMRLGHIQYQEQQKLHSLGASYPEFSLMHLRHVEEVRSLRAQHQRRFDEEERASYEKIEALKKASAEVLAFEKFYQGLDNEKEDNAAFLSDIEIQELMETEIMLEQYDRYYV